MPFFDPAIISLLVPPCIGAFIGYITNKIAILMLFRPLKPWRLFGFRVPMTPGVIPAKRHALAENIGAMVGRRLLTDKDIGGAISAEPFQEHVSLLVERQIGAVLQRDFGPLPGIVPGRFTAYFQVGVTTLKYQLAGQVKAFMGSADFAEQVRRLLEKRLDEMLTPEADGLLPSDGVRRLAALLSGQIRIFLGHQETSVRLAGGLAGALRRAADEGRTMGEVLPREAQAVIRRLVLDQGPVLLEKLGDQLADPWMRREAVRGILSGLDAFLDTMGPVGAMARGFFETRTVEEKIGAHLESRREDLLTWLRRPEIQSRMMRILEEKLEDFFRAPLAELLRRAGGDSALERLCLACTGHLATFLRREEVQGKIEDALASLMAARLRGGPAMKEEKAEPLPEEGGPAVREVVIQEVLALCRSPRAERLAQDMTGALVDAFLARPVGRLYNLIPHGVRQGITGAITMTLNRILLQEVPGIVRSLNLERVVAAKVDSFDLLQLEQLLLSIMEEQFKYINLFGALLGFLLGWINVLLGHWL